MTEERIRQITPQDDCGVIVPTGAESGQRAVNAQGDWPDGRLCG